PYTTAVKGHVAIEYFFLKLSRRGRIIVDTVCRSIGIVLFSFLTWKSVHYGSALKASGQVTPTLQVPVFWVPYVIALSCGVVVLVILHNLLHPGKEMIKP
ncbi:MAG: TRAP transporter small permease, partial [Candidatus Hydrogenedentes bacterium]|nr:TRAP transporter small permease [Candidatus Hydrogenedentota bacterium]